jgi:type I restriction-modification system DNA methylase subunit/REP element-mobilizing transposase RayT
MSLFQKTIVSKYLKTQKQENIHLKWESFKEHFHNSEIQNNIRNSKEEEYQEGFLRDLFVTVLGYTLKPQINHNLYRELKNVNDSKKADGGIIVNDIVTAVIELKGTDTTDLGKVESQAFGYKNNQSGCKYVITSNFEKLCFYIDNAIEFLEFNLFELTKEEFELLYLCLAYENIAADIPSKLKNESLSKEDEITKNLYKDYSVFKRELFQNLTQQNPDFNPLELFKKSQKLLDRLLFLFFGEDRGLLPVNFTRGILNDWKKLKELDAYIPLYDRFKQNFGYIDQGGKKDVFAYNGGLFKPDEILDNITIDDDLLYSHTYKLAEYDFASEVDVNILGHIFENSLNEIDEIKAQLEGQEIDKTKTKRKKDGVFYTPKYITKYIVENTVGKLCEEKKTEIGIVEEEYFTDKKRQQKTKLALLQKLENYRKWLHQITIIDPACGSGAFLNEALNFLIKEHKYIDELDSKLDKKYGTYGLEFNIKNSILENNLFGVDLNEESVEIAKLSLWLRTAEPNRKLNDLSHNIKCGNSLIDDPEIAGDKAFHWEKEFPQIFKEKKAFHLVFTTHNSRISERMKQYGIVPGKSAELSLPQEIKLAEIFAEIAKNYELEILAWNICKDHLHIVLACTEEELYHQVRLMKSISSKKLNEWMNTENPIAEENANPMGLDPLLSDNARLREALEDATSYFPNEHNNHLWSQKFFSVDTESWKWISDQESGFPYVATHLSNAIDYILWNRKKHQLPKSTELEEIIAGFVKTPEEVFKNKHKGGFDVVIGNPPYVRQELLAKKDKEFFVTKYSTGNGTADLYVYFYEKAINILQKNGILGFITPNKFYKTKYGKELRQYLIKYKIIELVDFFELKVFEDASTDSQILILEKNNTSCSFNYSPIKNIADFKDNLYSRIEIDPQNLSDEIWVFNNSNDLNILNKMKETSISLDDYTKNGIFRGITTGLNEAFIINEEIKNKIIAEDPKSSELIKPYVTGTEIEKFNLNIRNKYYLLHIKWEFNPKEYPGIFKYLEKHKLKLEIRPEVKEKRYNWYAMSRYASDYFHLFELPKIIYIHTAVHHKFYYDEEGYYINNSCYLISNADKFLSVWLNSKIFSFYKKLNFVAYGDSSESGRAKLDYNKMINVPIPNISENKKQPFIEKADEMLSLNKEMQEISEKFQRTLQREIFTPKLPEALPQNNLSKKLQNWYELSFADFLKELSKSKGSRPLGLSEKAEWEDYFLQEQQKAISIKSKIEQTDAAIDQMVYELYGLTEEEIEIVENS